MFTSRGDIVSIQERSKMKMARFLFSTVLIFFCVAANQARAAAYTVIDLNPAGFDYSDASGISGIQPVGCGYSPATGDNDHALLWNGSADNYVDLNPSGFDDSFAYGISGTQQVGSGYGPATGFNEHALLWNGSASSYVDLNPSGFDESVAYEISGTQQVGYGYGPATGGRDHALLWNGSASNYVDLNPTGFDDTEAEGTSGTQQVGGGSGPATGGQLHALLWNGSADNYVDLNPSGFDDSSASGISGTQQVGTGYGPATGGSYHALLWNGSASNYVDLNPSGFDYSSASGISGTQQVGDGWGPATGNLEHALLWNGSASNYVDLHQFLPVGFVGSYANDIDNNGNIVGGAYDDQDIWHAIIWIVSQQPIEVAISGNTGVDGVTMSGLPGNPITSGGGSYTVSVPSGWSGTVTPTKTGYTFTPPSITYNNVTIAQLNQNYTAAQTQIAPSITSVSPNSMPASNSPQSFKVYGSNFDTSSSHLLFTDPIGNPYTSASHPTLETRVSSAEFDYQINNNSAVGTWWVKVQNPDGQMSNAVSFTVTASPLPGSILYGIDVSHYQNDAGPIIWSTVAETKSFVFVKASQGTDVPDGYNCNIVGCPVSDNTAANIQGATEAGLLVSPYHLAVVDDSSNNGAISEAQYFLSRAGNYIGNGYLPPTLDLESMYGLTGTQLSQWVRAWLQYVQQQKPGTTPIVYTTRSVLLSLDSDLQSYPLWIATDDDDQTGIPCYLAKCWPDWKFKQYLYGDHGGTCIGITGPVDLDSFHGDFSALMELMPTKFGTLNGKNFKQIINGITLSLTGSGLGVITGNNFDKIILNGTGEKSQLTISSKAETSVGDIIVNGPLKGISAKNVNLRGNISVTGSLGTLTLNDVADSHTITIGAPAIPNSKAATTIAFDRVADLTINSQMPLKSITATEWLGGSINAPSVGSITTKGDKKRVIPGDLDVNVMLDGSINSAKVAGTLSGDWTCNSVKSISAADIVETNLKLNQLPDAKILALGKLTTKGWIDSSQILSTGNIGTVTAGAIIDSNCFAGVAEGITGLPAAEASSFDNTATIKSIAIKGIKGISAPYYFVNSNIAATNILSASIVYPQSDNGGVPFGLSADYIKKLTIKKTDGKSASFKELKETKDSNTIDGVEIRLY